LSVKKTIPAMAIPLGHVCTGTVATPQATGQPKGATIRHLAIFWLILFNR